MTFVVGLTGGIGSGKSSVADLLVQRGAGLVDTDRLAHALTAPHGAAIEPLRDAFGQDFITPQGALDRARMRALVFTDPTARARLEAVLHPLIRAQARCDVSACRAPYVVLVVPLLIESGNWHQRCQRVLVVDCPAALQRARVMARSGLPAEEVDRIIAAQASRDMRLAVADDVIDNSGDAAALVPQVDRLHALYLALAQAEKPDPAL
jgi:dephospho-CoA kinase